ncbi:dNTP triphosphohydrolase [Hymenobacter sp. H14-R3]|uniref:dGTP triphosphohydrolase n=1 Tax=Hymenobacter sp. H14-R3 TaxID=3046308 RepID=UPI0024BBE04E|nr:dNTP triphosphohydrolase [Hymenobacter sp. H14-R3]MDJ0363945.1 dNTP triphosphohydrolase [Hymenobacter sp. H14-R3]
MSLPLSWPRLLSTRRYPDRPAEAPQPGRSPYLADYDRVVFSSAFRRLQRKTQVMPLPETDFVHTRLTHSLETACVGRSLGRLSARRVLENEPAIAHELPDFAQDCGDIVAAACLAHDIGNPPFGHSGEDAISAYFTSRAAERFITGLGTAEQSDLQHFEGNAAGFRILTHTYPALSSGSAGLGLTYATLGAFTKYPRPSVIDPGKRQNGASEKKYGHFQAENPRFKLVAAELGLLPKDGPAGFYHRHPLAFLVEAADDICYRIIDFEDGLKLGLIDHERGLALLRQLRAAAPNARPKSAGSGGLDWRDWQEELGYLRATLIGQLVDETATRFAQHAPAILAGTYDASLIKELSGYEFLQEIQQLSVNKLYRSRPVLEIEAAGFEVLGGLLDVFLSAIFDKKENHRSRKLLDLLPAQFRAIGPQAGASAYEQILLLTDYVAGMTDQHALSLYKTIKGIELPKGF